jgi:hypothetical protein
MIFVLIKSCNKNRERRSAQRATWINLLPSDWTYAFFIGAGRTTDEPDVVSLEVKDDKPNISVKVFRALEWVREEFNPSNVLVVDDDTFLHPQRLVDSGFQRFHCTGLLRQAHESNNHTPYPQGSAFWLSRKALDLVLSRPDIMLREHKLWGVGDDLAIGQCLKGKIPIMHDDRYTDDVFKPTFPSSKNTIISAHKCSPEDMLRHQGDI